MGKLTFFQMGRCGYSDEKYTSHFILLGGLYVLFMYPMSYFGFGDGVSINYTFLLLPVISIGCYGFSSISKTILVSCAVYFLIFAFSFIFDQMGNHEHEIRRILSFIAFMSLFSFHFVNKKFISINSFKAGLVGISVILSFVAICKYINLCILNEACLDVKAIVGSQRYGFLYILAIWALLFFKDVSVTEKIIKYGLLAIVEIGLALTYSRSSVVALIVTFVGYAFIRFFKNEVSETSIDITVLCAVTFLIFLLFNIGSIHDAYLKSGIPQNMTEEVANQNASAGYRLMMWREVIAYVLQNPMLGSGFKGVWILSEGMSGSAHNQYFDVLFRVGLVGFVVYLSIVCKIFIKLLRLDCGLFLGFLGVLIIGVFHETFKLSHGAFVLSFLYRWVMIDECVQESSG
jgi:O-antigen ligase